MKKEGLCEDPDYKRCRRSPCTAHEATIMYTSQYSASHGQAKRYKPTRSQIVTCSDTSGAIFMKKYEGFCMDVI